MADIRSSTWSTTASGNDASPPDGWPEGQTPSSINNCAREMMAAIKRSWNDDHPVNESAGSNSAYQLVTSASSTAYATGDMYVFRANHASVGTSTLNVNGIGARIIKKVGDIDTKAGDISANQIVQVAYHPADDIWQIISQAPISLDEISNIGDLSGASDGDVLTYDATSSTFVPAPLPAQFPAGGIIAWAASTLPGSAGDWLECNGQEVSETTYADLFAVIGTTYNTGGESAGNFRVPNIAGRVIAGQESSASVLTSGGIDSTALGDTGGTSTHTLTQAETPVKSHTHTTSGITNTLDGLNTLNAVFTGGSTLSGVKVSGHNNTTSTGTISTGGNVDAFGTSAASAHNIVQPTIIMKWIIKT